MSDHDATTLPAETLSADILRGVKAISGFTGEPTRRVHYLLERGQLPAGQVGRTWVASKSVLRAHYARLTGAV
jgi:hypothetical protein